MLNKHPSQSESWKRKKAYLSRFLSVFGTLDLYLSDLEKAVVYEALKETTMWKENFQELICAMKTLLLYNFTKNAMKIKKLTITLSARLIIYNAMSYW